MEIKEVMSLLKGSFQYEVDMTDWEYQTLGLEQLWKAEFQNNYVVIRELMNCDYFEICFFKSDFGSEKIYEDYLDYGVTFYPRTIEALKVILECLDV